MPVGLVNAHRAGGPALACCNLSARKKTKDGRKEGRKEERKEKFNQVLINNCLASKGLNGVT